MKLGVPNRLTGPFNPQVIFYQPDPFNSFFFCFLCFKIFILIKKLILIKIFYFLLKNKNILNLIIKLYFYILNLYLFLLKKIKKEMWVNRLGLNWSD